MSKACYHIEIQGIVQGVGFRPFVYRLARQLKLNGYVLNHDRGVSVRIDATPEQLEGFVTELRRQAPAASRIDAVTHTARPERGYTDFTIRKSGKASASRFVPLSPDLALCPACRAEIRDPTNRRYFYPFTNCTNCGPRLTIIQGVPYDREKTTMARFPMCEECRAEYENPEDRRFHAQPNACHRCGPQLSLLDRAGRTLAAARPEDHGPEWNRGLLARCSDRLREGEILAIKGIGGFHLACDARNEAAVARLRQRKVRERKPFAVMFPGAAAARQHVRMTAAEEELLGGAAAPVVLLEKLAAPAVEASIAESVAPDNRYLGVLLPYSPLHELLLQTFGGPLLMTSGNRSDEPIVTDDAEAVKHLEHIADAYLLHDRGIHLRCDDSVVQSFGGKPFFYRRSRGYAPSAIAVSAPFRSSILAVGAELKNTFCLTRKDQAFLSHHIGDLENLATLEAFESGVLHFCKLFNIRPEHVAYDLHPDYLNTKWAKERFSEPGWEGRLIGVQHHHAHIAGCLEENRHEGLAIGLALDGTGYGTDGGIWGGELLLADRRDFLRAGHLRNVPLPGGSQAIRNPWRSALAYLHETLPAQELPALARRLPFLSDVPPEHSNLVLQMLDKKLNCPLTSSCGRLFDGVSALLGVTIESCYEGQAAIELERLLHGQDWAAFDPKETYPFPVEYSRAIELDWRPVFLGILKDIQGGVAPATISLRFHCSLVQAWASACEQVSRLYDVRTVALGGGCFLNEFLRRELKTRLERQGFTVLHSERVPSGDGGIAFGQAVVANQIVSAAKSEVWRFAPRQQKGV
ncbi:MAG: carbamoyltransferase HypF [Oligoflexia bacterium]|nr:carbamoyltransferase HypF [Oligoflexia bacterium]